MKLNLKLAVPSHRYQWTMCRQKKNNRLQSSFAVIVDRSAQANVQYSCQFSLWKRPDGGASEIFMIICIPPLFFCVPKFYLSISFDFDVENVISRAAGKRLKIKPRIKLFKIIQNNHNWTESSMKERLPIFITACGACIISVTTALTNDEHRLTSIWASNKMKMISLNFFSLHEFFIF